MDIVSEPIELDALEPSQEETQEPMESTLEPARVEPKRGRPKGSTNKPKGAPILAPIPEQIQPIPEPIQPIPTPKARAIAKARAPRAEPREVMAEVRDPAPASIHDLMHLLSLRLSDEREGRQQRRMELYRGFLE
jgi:hypothetical protein